MLIQPAVKSNLLIWWLWMDTERESYEEPWWKRKGLNNIALLWGFHALTCECSSLGVQAKRQIFVTCCWRLHFSIFNVPLCDSFTQVCLTLTRDSFTQVCLTLTLAALQSLLTVQCSQPESFSPAALCAVCFRQSLFEIWKYPQYIIQISHACL